MYIRGGIQLKSRKKTITVLVLLIAVLSFITAFTGVFYSWSEKLLEFTTVRGQTIEILNYGIYKYNSNALVAEGGVAWDAVTLFFSIPLLLLSLVWFRKGSIRGSLLLAGTLSYFLYQYLSYSVGWAFNQYFLLYVAIYSLSLISLIFTVLTIKVSKLPEAISNKFPRKTISIYLLFIGGFFMLLWLGTILPSIINNSVPDLKGQTTLVTQALDLGIIVPFCFASGILLLKKNAYGYLFSSIVIMKSLTMSLALVSMAVAGSVLTGSELNVAVLSILSVLCIIGVSFAVLLIKNIKEA
jgi:hypothetical protein